MTRNVCIYNLSSGSTSTLEMLKIMFEQNGVKIDKWIKVTRLSNAVFKDLDKNSRVYVVGGDGTLNAVAGYLVGSELTMVPLPGGTFNHFIKDLGISAQLNEAISDSKKYKRQSVDVGSVNDIYFLNNSSMGLYARTLSLRESLQKSYGKWPALLIANVAELWNLRRYRIEIEGVNYRTPLVFIGNNHYELSSNTIGERNSIDKGVLSLYITKVDSIWRLLALAVKVLLRQSPAQDEIKHALKDDIMINITNRDRVYVSHDGEVTPLQTPLRFKILPGALHVMAPAGSRSKKR